jgi:hypothetical protein
MQISKKYTCKRKSFCIIGCKNITRKMDSYIKPCIYKHMSSACFIVEIAYRSRTTSRKSWCLELDEKVSGKCTFSCMVG